MTRLAVTGHRGLPKATAELVDAALRDAVREYAGDLVGLSCLADGADSLFARAVLDHGGALTVVVPAASYRDELPKDHHTEYDALFSRANETIRLEHRLSTSESHMDASNTMLRSADALLAVWDGAPARGYGGTADVVRAARDRGMSVTVVWPDGARRD